MDRRQILGTQNELDQINLNLKMRWNVVLIISLGTLILFVFSLWDNVEILILDERGGARQRQYWPIFKALRKEGRL